MHAIRPVPSNPFAQDAPPRPDLGPNPEPWVQAEIDRLRDRNRTIGDALAKQADALARLRGVLASLQSMPTTPVGEALALVSLERGLCSQCWSPVIPACGCGSS
jgi:hypothetical protein